MQDELERGKNWPFAGVMKYINIRNNRIQQMFIILKKKK